jgi:hypothetical protein
VPSKGIAFLTDDDDINTMPGGAFSRARPGDHARMKARPAASKQKS